MKKRTLSVTVAVLAASSLVLAGCNAGSGSEGDAGTVTLDYWTMLEYDADNPRSQAEKQIIDQFMEENPGIKVNVDSVAWNELPRKTLLAVQGGGGPDVARVSFGQTLEYLTLDTLRPLDEFLDEDDVEDLLGERAVFDGKRMGLVFSPVPNAILYRTDLFEATGLPAPTTWEELAEVAQAMTTADVSGFGIGLQPGKTRVTEFMRPFAWGEGETIFDDAWTAKFDGEASVASYQFIIDLIEDGAMPEEVLRLSNDDVLDGFKAGKFAAVVEESSRASQAASGAVTEGKVGVWRFPSADGAGSPPILYSWNIGMMKNTDHPEESWKLIEFLTGNEADRIKAEVSGELPSRASSDVEEYLNPISIEFLNYIRDYPDTPVPYVPDTERFLDVTAQAMQNVFVENMTAKEALTKATEEYNSAR